MYMKEPTRRFKDLYWGNKENQVLFCTALSFSKNFRICLAITPTQTVHECSNEENADIYRDRRIRKRCYNTPSPPPPLWSSLFYFLACLYKLYTYIYIYIPGGPEKTEQSIQSIFQDFALINNYLFSPCWIEHLFLIIITPRSLNLVENFLFYE